MSFSPQQLKLFFNKKKFIFWIVYLLVFFLFFSFKWARIGGKIFIQCIVVCLFNLSKIEKKEELFFSYLLPLLVTSLMIMIGIFLFLDFLLDKLKRIKISSDDFLKLLKEKQCSLDEEKNFSLLRLEKLSAFSESNDKKMLAIKGQMIVKSSKRIITVDFTSWIYLSQINLLKDYGFFPAEFNRQRKIGFYWWKVLLTMGVLIAIPVFLYVAIFFDKRFGHLFF